MTRGLRPARLLLALLAAGCATGLRRPATTVGVDLDGDWRVDRIETIEGDGRPDRSTSPRSGTPTCGPGSRRACGATSSTPHNVP